MANTTLNMPLQNEVSRYLQQLADLHFAAQVGLFGERLLSPEDGDVKYSFTLFEKSPEGFKVRVQTDNNDQPFDISEGIKLELGSTAKLRVLTTYLEIVTELHDNYGNMPGGEPAKDRSVLSGQHQPLGHRLSDEYQRTEACR